MWQVVVIFEIVEEDGMINMVSSYKMLQSPRTLLRSCLDVMNLNWGDVDGRSTVRSSHYEYTELISLNMRMNVMVDKVRGTRKLNSKLASRMTSPYQFHIHTHPRRPSDASRHTN